MDNLTSLILLALLVGVANGDAATNQFMDSILHTSLISEIVRGRLDPLAIPSFDDSAKGKMGPFHVDIKAEYSLGNLTGLSKPFRMGDCSPVYYQFGNASFNCSITFGELDTEYQGEVKYGRLPKRRIYVQTSFSYPLIIVEVTSARTSGKPSLRRLQLASLGPVDVDIDRSGPLPRDNLEKALGPALIKKSSEIITSIVFGQYTTAMDSAIKNTYFPPSLWN